MEEEQTPCRHVQLILSGRESQSILESTHPK
jgi:hypothetical protein